MVTEMAVTLLCVIAFAWLFVLWPAMIVSGRIADQENQAAAELIGRNPKHGPD